MTANRIFLSLLVHPWLRPPLLLLYQVNQLKRNLIHLLSLQVEFPNHFPWIIAMSFYFVLSAEKYPPNLPWPNISEQARWSVSSFKFGFGPECLQDGDPDTFWQ